MEIKYKDGNGDYTITVHRDKTATVKHYDKGVKLLKKDCVSLESAKLVLSRYCDGMPSEIKIK